MNSRILTIGVVLALALSQAALADSDRRGRNRDRGHEDFARVVDVEPVIEHVRYLSPVQDCWVELHRRGRADKTGAAIVGGAVGALIGNTIARDDRNGSGRIAATLSGATLGATVGAVLGREAARHNNRSPRYEEVQRCETHHEERFEERVVGYEVTYEYDGRRGVTRLPREPGRYIRVAVDVHPLG